MRLHLIDGTYELFRAHYSKRPSRVDLTGRDVKATVGMLDSLLALLADTNETVSHLGIAFDNPIESFRNQQFAAYKDGSEVDPALKAQFDLAEEAAMALGITVWSMDTFEADDALASAAVQFEASFDQVRILTPDKDLAQVVRGQSIIQVDRARDRVYDEGAVLDKFGVLPSSIPDYLALVGDTADGIPGITGFGAKSAAAILSRYHHLEHIPALSGDWDIMVRGAARLAERLATERDNALLYRDLATLRCDVQVGLAAETAFAGGVSKDFARLCEQLDATRLLSRLP